MGGCRTSTAVPSVPRDDRTKPRRVVSRCAHRFQHVDGEGQRSLAARSAPRRPRRGRRRQGRRARRGRAARWTPSRSPGREVPRRAGRGRLERLDVTEVVAAEDHARGLLLGDERAHRLPLCISPERISTTLRPGSMARWWRSASVASGATMRSKAPAGSSIRRVWTATARPFSSMKASAAPRATQHARELALEARETGGRARGEDALLGRRPALVSVLAEDEELGAAVEHRVAPTRPGRPSRSPAGRGGP